MATAAPPRAYIGVDVGGTHTDASIVLGDRIARGKALTTYGDFGRGVLEAVDVAAAAVDRSLTELLSETRLFVNGTTVVTNAITTLQGARVGVLITRGFKDTFRLAGGAREAAFDDHVHCNPPDLVERAAIVEVDERIDYSGAERCTLDAAAVERATRLLVEELAVEALAICFVNSHTNPAHELAARDVVRRLYPDLFVTPSHQAFPLAGENRRFHTAVLNCFVYERAAQYVDGLDSDLRRAGLAGGLVFVQGLGGGIGIERAKEFPLALLGSGPAGGALGAVALAERMGLSRVLLGDMGGTSFDTGIVVDGEIALRRNLQLGHFATGVHLVDVASIGAGGGSIVEVSERAVPQVGPRSAASIPGPACYGRGGEEPTVTDAMVSLGFIDPDHYLGGRFKLDRELASRALDVHVGRHYGWTVEQSADAVHDLVVANMANAVREISVGKGEDPRDFTFLAYGGTLPLFAVEIARRLGIEQVVVPHNSSVFSAMGLLCADFVRRLDRTVNWELSRPDEVERVNRVADELVDEGREFLRREGFADQDITITRTAAMRFAGQAFELEVGLEDRPLAPADAETLFARFVDLYEQTYGEGTAWKGVPAVMVTLGVTMTGRVERPRATEAPEEPTAVEDLRAATRTVHLPRERRTVDVPVYDDARVTAGSRIDGPAIIDSADTTLYVPEGASARRDTLLNYILTTGGSSAS